MKGYIRPTINEKQFTCPHCKVLAMQTWVTKSLGVNGNYGSFLVYDILDRHLFNLDDTGSLGPRDAMLRSIKEEKERKRKVLNDFDISICANCSKATIWIDGNLVVPKALQVPEANEDMPEKVKEIYYEAAEVFNTSVKSSGALLRLATQYLCEELGYEKMNINDAIKIMVENGLDKRVERSLDIIRVIGNNAVHPGEINLDEKKEDVIKLFSLLNFIVKSMITDEKEINELFQSLPEGAKNGIEKRNSKINKN